jgi:hypothetical protein
MLAAAASASELRNLLCLEEDLFVAAINRSL